jgi:integron integrase
MDVVDLQRFDDFLREGRIVPERNRPWCLRWVERFLKSPAAARGDLSAEDRVRVFVEDLSGRGRLEDWQIDQADKSVRLYLFTFLEEVGKAAHGGEGEAGGGEGTGRGVYAEAFHAMRERLRLRHYSYRTEQTYLDWVERYFAYAKEGGFEVRDAGTVKRYLAHLAMDRRVSASTQNQAFSALLFLFRAAWDQELGDLSKGVRAKDGRKLPVVLSVEETRRLFDCLHGTRALCAKLLYGGGLRLSELCRLRVKDIDFDGGLLFVRGGKGNKDRSTLLPESLKGELREHMKKVRGLWQSDRERKVAGVYLPNALARKYPNAGIDWRWFWVLPSKDLSVDPRGGVVRRHHISDRTVQRLVQRATREAGIAKPVSAHTMRHSFATHLLLQGVNIRQVQEYMGHAKLETTMIYTHVMKELSPKADSPLDRL